MPKTFKCLHVVVLGMKTTFISQIKICSSLETKDLTILYLLIAYLPVYWLSEMAKEVVFDRFLAAFLSILSSRGKGPYWGKSCFHLIFRIYFKERICQQYVTKVKYLTSITGNTKYSFQFHFQEPFHEI